MLELLTDPEAWIALATLAALEIVLGIDNVVFIAILVARLPERQRKLAYRIGLGGAMVTRIILLFAISWVMGLTAGLFTLLGQEISGRDIILIVGGLFLLAKSTTEIYNKVERHEEEEMAKKGAAAGFIGIIIQISLLDLVFSLDSVITAVGMVDEVAIMVVAVVLAIAVMMIFARSIGEFVNRNPSMKILALSFLMLIGALLVAEGLGQHLNKGYIYFAMGFALLVELLNMRFRKKKRVATSEEAVP